MGDIQVDSASAGNIYKPKQDSVAPQPKPILDSIYTVAKDARASKLMLPDSPSIYQPPHADEKHDCATYQGGITTCAYDNNGRSTTKAREDEITASPGFRVFTDATSTTPKQHKATKGKK